MIARKTRAFIAAIAALATTACASTGGAGSKEWVANERTVPIRLAEVGSWQMAATRLNDAGEPECYETWIFKKDGTGTLISGEQVITLSWRYSNDSERGPLLYKTFETSKGATDCLGRYVDTERYPSTNGAGYELLFYKNGNAARICFAPGLTTFGGKSTPIQTFVNCWGELTPLAD